MARILSNESSLSRQRTRLARETGVLRVLMRVEAALAALLAAAGAVQAITGRGYGLLMAAAALAFIAAAHFVKTRQNARDAHYATAGLRGESEVAKLLGENLDNDYYLYHDIRVRSGFTTAQIDHLVVCAKGMFVLETKNWRGRLVGSENDPTWLQYKEPNLPPRSLANPIRQNLRHAAILEKFLRAGGVPAIPIVPMLVFTGRDTTLEIKGENALLMWPREAVDYILRFKRDPPLPAEVIDKALHRLQRCV
jgi:hypothetical protein